MNLKFNICSVNVYQLQITGDSKYLNEEVLDNLQKHYLNNEFKYSETCTINIVKYHPTSGETIYDIKKNLHKEVNDVTITHLNKDGFYSIHHIVLPTLEWFNSLGDVSYLLDKIIYITDGVTLYQVVKNIPTEISWDLITEVNPLNTTISVAVKNTFAIQYLKDCYITYSKLVFNQMLNSCINNSKEILFIRDLINMTLNIIKYNVELDLLNEALRTLERFTKCNGLCNQPKKEFSELSDNYNCGCLN